ncbi:MAG TPA: nuclear transport factor 2 family protein [Flavisolibacter sp.]|jgi:hypothetical protein|nr:nuclear transport factor 2 family protein [Flavisolibacter sp.]
MKKILISLFATCLSSVICAQVSFDQLPQKEQEEIMKYMADFSKISQAAGYIAITPNGKIWDKQNYEPPMIFSDTLKYDGTPLTEFIYRSITPIPETRKVYIYNGNTLVLHGVSEVRAEIKGQPVKFRVARLETHVKSNGKWEMAAGSGTYVEPPTPAKM